MENPTITKNIVSQVPLWEAYFPNLADATKAQKNFYLYWKNELEKGKFINLEENISYIFVYLYDVLERFLESKDIKCLNEKFGKVIEGYCCYEKVVSYIYHWSGDAYLYLSDFDNWWEKTKKNSSVVRPDMILTFRAKCSDTSITGDNLIGILGSNSGITKFVKQHLDQIKQLATIFLTDFQKQQKKNIVEFFCRKFDFANLNEESFEELKKIIPYEKDFMFWKDMYLEEKNKCPHKYPHFYNHFLFGGAPIWDKPFLKCESIPSIIQIALENELKKILREAENTIRNEIGLPKVGEGWISETELFYKILDAFPNEEIVHHGRPSWLTPQHLDIYFPKKNIAIEYQGKQHLKAIDFFGGEKAFKKLETLDRKKELLCQKNTCKLLYVYEGYDFDLLKIDLKKLLDNPSVNVIHH